MRKWTKKTTRGGVLVANTPTPSPLDMPQWSAPPTRHPITDAHEAVEPTPCRVCGGPVPTTGAYWDRWRQHDECARLVAWPPARMVAAVRVLGLGEIGEMDAGLVAFRIALYLDDHPEPIGTPGTPWAHVDQHRLRAALAGLPARRVEAGLVEVKCTDGPCAWCGVTRAQGWTAHGHQWPDRSPAPLCGPCGVVYERHGSPAATYWDADQRAAIGEALTGATAMMGESAPAGLLAYAETSGETDGTPWSHLPAGAVEAYRWAAWGRFGGRYAPPEHRAEAVARVEARQAETRAATAAVEAEQSSRMDVYGFEVTR